jgi:hypothetical protein
MGLKRAMTWPSILNVTAVLLVVTPYTCHTPSTVAAGAAR